MTKNRLACCLGIAIALVANPESVRSAVLVTAEQVGADVVVSGGGTLDLTTWSYVTTTGPPGVGVLFPGLSIGGDSAAVDQYRDPVAFDGPNLIPPPGGVTPIVSGDVFGINPGLAALGVPAGYVSGNPLTGSATFAGTTIQELGLVEGSLVWTWGSGSSADSFTFTVVPEPSTPGLLTLGLLALARRQRTHRMTRTRKVA